MIVKGHARTNGGQLAAYLADYLTHEKNERVQVLEIHGSTFPDLHRSLSGWEAEARRGKTKKALWHAQISPTPGEFLTREQQIEAVNILERHLGYEGQPRATVVHKKDGREHIHVVWSRIDRATGKAKRDDFTHRKNCDAAREMELRFGLDRVETPRFRSDDKTKTRKDRREESKTAPDRRDFQKAARSGLDPRERKRIVTECWVQSDCGKALRGALQDNDYILAHGSARSYVIVDKAGDIHSLPRQIKGVFAADVKERLKDLDPASIPKATHVQRDIRAARREQEPKAPRPANTAPPPQPEPLHPLMSDAPTVDDKPFRDPLDPCTILADLTQQQSTFTKTDLERDITKRLEKHGKAFGQEEIDELTRAVRKLPDFISLGADRVGRTRYTSRDMLDTELLMRDTADKLAGQNAHAVRDQVRDAAPKAAILGEDQKDAFRHVVNAGGIALVVGYAGTGKSTMLGAARESWEAEGYRVRGASLSSMAAASLQNGSGIQSRTLASLLWRLKNVEREEQRLWQMNRKIETFHARGDESKRWRAKLQAERDQQAARVDASKLTKRDIIVLDEAAMVGSRQMTTLLTEAHKAGAKVVLVGDAEQLQAIDAGGAFRALRERHGAVEITDIRRQKEEWQRQATKDFAQSFTEDAMDAYAKRGNIHQTATADEAYKQMVDAWTKARLEQPDKTQLMMAFTHRDVNALNASARKAYRDEGLLGTTDTEIVTERGKKAFSRGDRMYFLKNDLRLGVMNGSLGTLERVEVSQFDKGKARLTVALDDGKSVTFTPDVYNSFSHGYAATVHKAQGATVDRAHLLASRYMDRHSAYVGMSRHRETVDLYFADEEFRSYKYLVTTLSRDRRKDTTLDYLDRAEKAQQPERFWKRVTSPVAEAATRPVDVLLSALSLNKREKTPEERIAAMEAKRMAEKLRAALGKRKGKVRSKFFGRTM